jgi:hypothetical protein
VLDAIPLSSSDFVRAKYFLLLFSQARLDPRTGERAIRESATEIGSDYERARVLTAAAEFMTIDEPLAAAFLDATNAIGSDYDHARVLLHLIAKQRTGVAATLTIASSTHIGSDYEQARVLSQVAEQKDLTDAAVIGIVSRRLHRLRLREDARAVESRRGPSDRKNDAAGDPGNGGSHRFRSRAGPRAVRDASRRRPHRPLMDGRLTTSAKATVVLRSFSEGGRRIS